MGIPEEKVEECLRAIPDVDIDSALEWVCCLDAKDMWSPNLSPAPKLTLHNDDGDTDFDNRLNGGSTEMLPANGASEIPEALPPTPAVTTRPVPTRVTLSSVIDSDDEQGSEVDVNTKWARTKTKLHMLKFGKPKGFKLDPNDPIVQKLESRLEALQSDYEFRKKHAEYTFQELRKAAEATALEESLRLPKEFDAPSQIERLDTPDPVEAKSNSTPLPITVPGPPNTADSDILDQYSDEEGGFFGHFLDEMPAEVTTTTGDVVRVYELAFPKNWIGSTPKSVLKDYVTRLDGYAIMSYRPIGGVTRVARAAVQLPIASFKSQIIESLDRHQVVVLSGETGCGKSTQLPAYILEDQLSKGLACKIYCTEPRRISAISLAQRVSRELGEPPNAVGTLSSLVGYSVRLESNITRNTRLAFVTNGIALRMLESGSGSGGKGTAFDEITHIIIDEVHERSIESDFLLIVLKSLMQQRPDLKIVLMSATVDAEKVSTYFGGPSTCPRTFPVRIQYLEDAVEFAKWSIGDDSPYARQKNDKFSRNNKSNRLDWSEETAAVDEDDEDGEPVTTPVKLGKQYSKSTISTIDRLDERRIPYELILRLLEKICLEDTVHSRYSAAVLVFLPGLGEIRRLTDMLGAHREFGSQSFRIYPLHSALPSENQTAVFEIPPPGIRKIVVSTNIAETGVTIPDITCVIDSGKHKEMRFDEKRQTSRLVETVIARSNAAQRRGRAGRVQDGLCFHLFTKSRHDNLMIDNSVPEILRLSLADLALRIKIMNVEIGTSVEDVLSRALDPPSSVNIQRAVNALIENLQQIEDLRQQFMGYLMDSGFINVDADFGREFKRIRFQRNRTKFMNVPEHLNSGPTNFGLIQAALTAGMFPKIISIDPSSGQMQTINNNRPVAFHPSSVNFKKMPRDFGSNYLCYSTLMQSKKLYASETGPASDLALILLCGDCEFKVASEQIIIDRKIRYRVPGKTALALKALKARLSSNMTLRLRAKQSDTEGEIWGALALELFKSSTSPERKGA
ncbi:hypothetical protein FRC06_002027 [Ceratobasidium sp. 370]|nr:hypothetical protein FRC06_002027 [Ceratobasidium sp. 370]